jgi:hypothetical protein
VWWSVVIASYRRVAITLVGLSDAVDVLCYSVERESMYKKTTDSPLFDGTIAGGSVPAT